MLKLGTSPSEKLCEMKETKPKMTQEAQMDPLYVIFEQHLFNFQDPDLDRKTFVGNVLNDYFSYLRKASIVVPKSLEPMISEELTEQVQMMLIKKIYGCLSIHEYQRSISPELKRKVGSRYTQLSKPKKKTI